ncbi:MAG: FkbM family methyltransferase [Planctomycetota bacterium]
MRSSLVRFLRSLVKEWNYARGRKAPCYMGNNKVLTHVRGFMMLCPSDDLGGTPHLIVHGHWELAVTHVFESVLKPGMTVLDIGANIGYFTLHAARSVGSEGKVMAFEPTPDNLHFLRSNLLMNGFSWVQVIDQALWNEAGTMTMRTLEGFSGGHTLIGVAPDQLAEHEMVEVPTVRLDDLLGHDNHVDVIKMDAEGAEPMILEGMEKTLAANPKLKILLEFAPESLQAVGRDYHEYLRALEKQGFSIGLIDWDVQVKPIDLKKLDELIPTRAWPQILLLERG